MAIHMSTSIRNVTTVATDEDVFVGDRCVGSVMDCGDCYRVNPRDKRRRTVRSADYGTRELAILALTAPYR